MVVLKRWICFELLLVLLPLACVTLEAAAQDRVLLARQQLDQKGIPFTPEAYLNAAREGNQKIVALFLQAEVQVDIADRDPSSLGYTALHWAAREGHLSTVTLLVEHGAEIRAKETKTGYTALHIALAARQERVSEYLVAKHAALFAIDEPAFGGATPLYIAAREGLISMVRLLLDMGADVEGRRHSQGRLSPLGIAVIERHTSVVRELLARGAQMEDVGGEDSALVLSARYRSPVIAQLLVARGANVRARGSDGWTALHWAARNGMADVVKKLIEQGASIDGDSPIGVDTPLSAAAFWGYFEIVRRLVDGGAEVNHKGLHGNSPLANAIAGGRNDVAIFLIKRGANVNAVGSEGRTPLIDAAARGMVNTVVALLKHGADVNARNESGDSALGLALVGNHDDVVRVLRAAGAVRQ